MLIRHEIVDGLAADLRHAFAHAGAPLQCLLTGMER
jgi:hypothetical protein